MASPGSPRRAAVARLFSALFAAALLAGCASELGRRHGEAWPPGESPYPESRRYPDSPPYPESRRPSEPRPDPESRRQTEPPPRQSVQPEAAAAQLVNVRPGDTVYALARRYGASPRAIVETNGLRAPYRLVVGQKIRIPGERRHVVSAGETAYAISRRYGVDLANLMRANDIGPPYTLKVGQTLAIPAAMTASRAAAQAPAAGAALAPPFEERTFEESEGLRESLLGRPAPSGGVSFVWPARGAIISRFGPKEGGLHNDGINIRLAEGAPVRAAERGVVAYAGDDLKGYGKLLLIRHGGGWVTAYAHNSHLLAGKGDTVERGQIVAEAGRSGRVGESQLHFEIRRGMNAVNPLAHLPEMRADAPPFPDAGQIATSEGEPSPWLRRFGRSRVNDGGLTMVSIALSAARPSR